MNDDPLLTPKEAAKRIGVCTETVKRWMRNGAIPYEVFRRSRYRRVRQSVIDAQLEAVSRETTSGDKQPHS